MRKLMSTLKDLACAVVIGSSLGIMLAHYTVAPEYASVEVMDNHVVAVEETVVAPEDCEHNISLVYDPANTEIYHNETMGNLFMDYAMINYCEECDWDYYKYCACDYEEYFNNEYHDDEFCSCGAYHYRDDYLAFVNDYVKYINACDFYCPTDDRKYYDHCCDDILCDFFAYVGMAPELSEEITNAYDNLPESVKKLFVDMDCTLDEVTSIDNDATILGTFRYNADIDYTEILIRRGIEDQDITVYHEFGHLLDYGYNEVFESETSYFVDIYNEEKDNFIVDYNYDYYVSSPKEYFAQAFAEYMTNPDRLYENTPFTYFYVDTVVNNIK